MSDELERQGWHLTQRPNDHARVTWRGGRFETARRARTAEVEGRITPDFHLVMVTLNGGAARHEFRTDDGFRYAGADVKRTVSFLPAGCNRDLALRDVSWEWGAIAIDPATTGSKLDGLPPFLIGRDDFIYTLTAEMGRLFHRDGRLEATYCSTMALALTEYLAHRVNVAPRARGRPSHALTTRQLRDTYDRIDAWFGRQITIADLANPLGISEGHFFRAFRGATGLTPLQAISAHRMEAAAHMLRQPELDITEIAARCGIESPSHFARVFKAHKGMSPSRWRQS
jgi:AraC family transcriptional regulator